MKSNKIYIFLAMLVATLTTTACFDDQGYDTLYDGNQVEFNAANLPNGLTQSFVRLTPTQTDILNVQINRVSTSGAAPITINIDADPTSTAVEGVHYRLDSKSITIGAGEFITTLPVTVLTGNIDPSETPDLILNITSATGAEVSSNYGSLKVAIRVICPSELAGTYSVFWEYLQLGDGDGGADQTATDFVIASASTMTFAAAGTGAYTMNDMSFGMYPGLYGDSRPTGTIRDNCNVLTGAASNQDRYGDPFTISGVVNDDDTITITWSNTYGDGGTVVLTKV